MKKGEKMQKDKNRTVKIRFKLTKMQETIDKHRNVRYFINTNAHFVRCEPK